jgi:hypothetical protein
VTMHRNFAGVCCRREGIRSERPKGGASANIGCFAGSEETTARKSPKSPNLNIFLTRRLLLAGSFQIYSWYSHWALLQRLHRSRALSHFKHPIWSASDRSRQWSQRPSSASSIQRSRAGKGYSPFYLCLNRCQRGANTLSLILFPQVKESSIQLLTVVADFCKFTSYLIAAPPMSLMLPVITAPYQFPPALLKERVELGA